MGLLDAVRRGWQAITTGVSGTALGSIDTSPGYSRQRDAMLQRSGGYTTLPPFRGSPRVLAAPHTVDAFTAYADQGNDTPIVKLMNRFPGYTRVDDPGTQAHELWLLTMRVIRKAVPALDAAIIKRRFLEGEIVIESDDQALADLLNEFVQNVQVGYVPDHPKLGLQVWLDALAENADEFGEAIGEIRLDEAGTTIERLVVPNPRLFSYRKMEGSAEDFVLHQYAPSTRQPVPVDNPMVRTFQFSPNPASPWGRPLAAGLEFTSEIFIRLMLSMNNLVWRMGDPAKLWQLIYSPDSVLDEGAQDDDLLLLQQSVESAYLAKNRGDVVDVFYGIQGGEVKSEALGENLLIGSLAPYLQGMMQQITAQVIGKADVPAWLYPAGIIPSEGLNSDRAQMEGTLAQVAADQRAKKLDRVARWVLNQYLILQGRSSSLGRYEITHVSVAPINEKMRQEARAQRAGADATFLENVELLRAIGMIQEGEEQRAYLESREVL